MTPAEFVEQVEIDFELVANPIQAVPMAAYMKNQFPFLGIPQPKRKQLLKPLFALIKGKFDETWLNQAAVSLWALPEREFQYVASDLLWEGRKVLSPKSLELAEELLQQKSWWDSVDSLSSDLVGPLVLRFPELKSEMDRFSSHPNFWLRRVALIHQLSYKDQTDAERLFEYCLANATDQEFFVRKGMGWALRQYAYTNPTAVYEFVEQNKDKLSALTIREALKHQ